jgi:prephenate dehydrogenase
LKVTVYGTGLIGGSFALALKRAFLEIQIAGVDRPEVLKRALELKIIDVAGPAAGPDAADLIVLATPIGEILRLLDQLPTDAAALITDVGSTKAAICEKAAQRGLNFVGGHPMAGLELSGPDSASPSLFEGAPFFLCSIPSTSPNALEEIKTLITTIGAIPHVISAEEHDRLVAQISHLPQIISSALADYTAPHSELAGPGLRSMTRMASSPFHIWRDIFGTSGYLPHELREFILRLQTALDSLEAGDSDSLEKLFRRGGSN